MCLLLSNTAGTLETGQHAVAGIPLVLWGRGARGGGRGGHDPFRQTHTHTKRVVVVSWWWQPCWLQPQLTTQPYRQRVIIDAAGRRRPPFPQTLHGPHEQNRLLLPSLPSHFQFG